MRSAHSRPGVSVVIPVFNEEANVQRLVSQASSVLDESGEDYEILLIDDGSDDRTVAVLRELIPQTERLKVLVLRRNFGQTAALQAGFDHARGEVIVTMDGDLQNDPRDIPELLSEVRKGADVVSGWRRDRQDTWLLRKLPSWVANSLIRRVTRVPVHDQGCSLKAYRREVVEQLDLYSDMHRFITVLTMMSAAKIVEVPVRHHPRRAGASKYGISRVGKVIADLLAIQLITRFRDHPVRWFSLLAFPFLFSSGVALASVPFGGLVAVTVSAIFALVSVSCVFAGGLAQLIVETAGHTSSRLICREWEGR